MAEHQVLVGGKADAAAKLLEETVELIAQRPAYTAILQMQTGMPVSVAALLPAKEITVVVEAIVTRRGQRLAAPLLQRLQKPRHTEAIERVFEAGAVTVH